ncbi:MAG: undecaprenyl-diphosphate phosphatase [Verrucomicrobiaceae bacterium]|nr:undecaprenyl-diphosphate phosphatase [Verrucomicrobiaceae bacterium]
MPDWLSAVLLGLIEGLTEFIPVSSTGHLLIAEHWLARQSELFNVVIQPAAALALVPLFWSKIKDMTLGLGEKANRDLLAKLVVAFVVTVAGVLTAKKLGIIRSVDKEHIDAGRVAWATLIGGFIIIAVEAWCRGRRMTAEITWAVAITFGIAQVVAAAFPGASRSGTTIMLAMMLGLARPAATEFSFLLGIPTLFAAGAKELKDAFEGPVAHIDWLSIGLGALASAVSAFVVVKWLIRFVQSHTFNGFAAYRIVLGVALLGLFYFAHLI